MESATRVAGDRGEQSSTIGVNTASFRPTVGTRLIDFFDASDEADPAFEVAAASHAALPWLRKQYCAQLWPSSATCHSPAAGVAAGASSRTRSFFGQ
jgi:hypothetical protein